MGVMVESVGHGVVRRVPDRSDLDRSAIYGPEEVCAENLPQWLKNSAFFEFASGSGVVRDDWCC